jgi:serine/threonine protein kinase
VEIGEQVLNYRGQRIVEYKPGRPQNPARVRLSCEMGDIWENRYGEVKFNQVIKTGEKFTDRVLEKLQNHGYAIQEVLAKGRFGNVILVYSFERAKYVAVKFLLGDLRKAV